MPEENLSTPFVTRDMLAFKGAVTFRLQLNIQSVTTNSVLISGLTREGIFTFKFSPAGTGAVETPTFGIPDFPIFVSVTDENNSNNAGQCFARLSLQLNQGISYMLGTGYIHSGQSIAWPATNLQPSTTHRGQIITIAGTDPAANVEITDTVPARFIWRLKSVRFQLVTDANAATRQVHLVIKEGGGIVIMDVAASTTQVTGLTRNYNFALFRGTTPPNVDSEINTALPAEIILPTDYSINTVTTSRQVGDNYGAPQYYIERELVIL